MLDFDKIRQEVAVKHNVLLSKDDPILASVTINELVLEQLLKLASSQNAEVSRQLTITLQQQVEQAKETAGRLITEATDYVAKEIERAVSSAMISSGNTLMRNIASTKISIENNEVIHSLNMSKRTAYIIALITSLYSIIVTIAFFYGVNHYR